MNHCAPSLFWHHYLHIMNHCAPSLFWQHYLHMMNHWAPSLFWHHHLRMMNHCAPSLFWHHHLHMINHCAPSLFWHHYLRMMNHCAPTTHIRLAPCHCDVKMRIWWLPPLGKSPFDVYSAWLRVHHGVEHWELEHQVLKQAYRSITVFFEAFFQLLTDSSHKGEANPRGQSAWKHKYLTTYFQLCASLNSHKKKVFSPLDLSCSGHSHAGSLFTREEQKGHGLWCIQYFCHMPALFMTWYYRDC